MAGVRKGNAEPLGVEQAFMPADRAVLDVRKGNAEPHGVEQAFMPADRVVYLWL